MQLTRWVGGWGVQITRLHRAACTTKRHQPQEATLRSGHRLLSGCPPPPQADLALLPSPVLHFSLEGEVRGSDEELLARLRTECAEYGEITECCLAEGGGAFVHFQEVRQAGSVNSVAMV